MFNNELTKKNNSFLFVGAFHLGIPLVFSYTKKSKSWGKVETELSNEFNKNIDFFEIANDDYEPETRFPLGSPLKLRYKKFIEYFDLMKYLTEDGCEVFDDEYLIDNRIWIYPSGVVLVIGCLSFDKSNFITLDQFKDRIILEHYPELTHIFIEVAKTILKVISPYFLKSSLVSQIDIIKCQQAIEQIKKFESSLEHTSGIKSLQDFIQRDERISFLLSEILIDVYYFHFQYSKNNESIKIGYVDSQVYSSDPSYLLIITIAFSSFIEFLWLIKHLGEKSRILQDALLGQTNLQEKISHELKLLRIFCLRFINESNPIHIRLTANYMRQIEECWKEFRLPILISQISDQLNTIEKMVDWIDEGKKETRNFKIGIAAVILALISLTAVIAQLISTIDFGNTIQAEQRAYLILLGFIIGVLSTLGIYFFHLPKKLYRKG